MDIFRKYFLYLTIFISGAAVLMIEILGTRVIAPFYGATVFTWSSLITVTLGMLALGYWLGGRWIDKRPAAKWLYGAIFLAAIEIASIIKASQFVLIFTDPFGLRFGPLAAAAILFAIPLFLLGTVTPFVIRLKTLSIERIGRESGGIFAFATLGSLAGALLSGFVLLPYFSLASFFNGIAFILGVNAILGFIIFRPQFFKAPVFFAAALILVYFIPAAIYQDEFNSVIIHQEQGHYGDLKVVESGGSRCVTIDGTLQSCAETTSEELSANYLEALRGVLEQGRYNNILILGFGGGAILDILPSGQKFDAVEIEPKIVALGRQYLGFEEDWNQNIVIDDARHFLRRTDKKYDFIIMDTFKGFAIPAHLATQEYFELLSGHLNKNGIVVINFFGRTGTDDLFTASFTRTIKSVFPKVIVAAPGKGLQNLLVFASFNDISPLSLLANYKEVEYAMDEGLLLVDSYNPMEVIALSNFEILRSNLKTFGGAKLFFAN